MQWIVRLAMLYSFQGFLQISIIHNNMSFNIDYASVYSYIIMLRTQNENMSQYVSFSCSHLASKECWYVDGDGHQDDDMCQEREGSQN